MACKYYFTAPILYPPMKKSSPFFYALLLLVVASCQKEKPLQSIAPVSKPFTEFIIPEGKHYAHGNVFKAVETTELKFTVRFDSSAIYTSTDPENQYDVNKLYGFADNTAFHQQFSARFGWRWSGGALRLFAYTYNNGVRDAKELGEVAIGSNIECAIKVAGDSYRFSVNGKVETMPRLSEGDTAKGYQLYPYFGGDEVAPHEVRVWISEE